MHDILKHLIIFIVILRNTIIYIWLCDFSLVQISPAEKAIGQHTVLPQEGKSEDGSFVYMHCSRQLCSEVQFGLITQIDKH